MKPLIEFETPFDPLDLAPTPDVDPILTTRVQFTANPMFAGVIGQYNNVILHEDSVDDSPEWLWNLLLTGQGAKEIQIVDGGVNPKDVVTWKNARGILERKK